MINKNSEQTHQGFLTATKGRVKVYLFGDNTPLGISFEQEHIKCYSVPEQSNEEMYLVIDGQWIENMGFCRIIQDYMDVETDMCSVILCEDPMNHGIFLSYERSGEVDETKEYDIGI